MMLKLENVARLIIDGNKVIKSQGIEGLDVQTKEREDGVDVSIYLRDNVIIEKPVHLCFGVLPDKGLQYIKMNIDIGKKCPNQSSWTLHPFQMQ